MEVRPRIDVAVTRLKGVFLEIPGTQLSLADASRLAGLERATCLLVLEAFERAGFVSRRHNGLFVRRTADSPLA